MTIDVDLRRPWARLDRMSLAHLIRRPVGHPGLSKVEDRRAALADLGDYPAHEIYGAPGRMLSPDQISLPIRYGHVLYSLAAYTKPRVAVESGSGFGVSGMYMLCALAERRGTLASFEIGDYWREAQASFDLMNDRGVVTNRPFEDFHHVLDPRDQVDFAFIDAVHDEATVLRSVRTLIGWMRPGGLIVLDDLTQNASMRAAWPALARHAFISLAVRVNDRFGILEILPAN